jgi:hypothetical protein
VDFGWFALLLILFLVSRKVADYMSEENEGCSTSIHITLGNKRTGVWAVGDDPGRVLFYIFGSGVTVAFTGKASDIFELGVAITRVLDTVRKAIEVKEGKQNAERNNGSDRNNGSAPAPDSDSRG